MNRCAHRQRIALNTRHGFLLLQKEKKEKEEEEKEEKVSIESGARRFFRETSLIAECKHRFFDASIHGSGQRVGRNKRAINCILVEPGNPGFASLIFDTAASHRETHSTTLTLQVSSWLYNNFSLPRTEKLVAEGTTLVLVRSYLCTGNRRGSTCEPAQVDHVVMSVHRPRRQFSIRIGKRLATAYVSRFTF